MIKEAPNGYYYIQKNRRENEEVMLATTLDLISEESLNNWELITIAEGIALQAEVNARLIQEMEVQNGNN